MSLQIPGEAQVSGSSCCHCACRSCCLRPWLLLLLLLKRLCLQSLFFRVSVTVPMSIYLFASEVIALVKFPVVNVTVTFPW